MIHPADQLNFLLLILHRLLDVRLLIRRPACAIYNFRPRKAALPPGCVGPSSPSRCEVDFFISVTSSPSSCSPCSTCTCSNPGISMLMLNSAMPVIRLEKAGGTAGPSQQGKVCPSLCFVPGVTAPFNTDGRQQTKRAHISIPRYLPDF